MSVKDRVLAALEAERGSFFYGEALAQSLGVSRNAVWKAVRGLQEAGHSISAVPNRGYCLSPDSNVLSPQSLAPYLQHDILRPEVFPELTSTNTVLKQRAEAGAPAGTVLFAETQTEGQGRRDHRFHSPPGGGIYMSLLLRPSFTAQESLCITTCAAVAVSKAIEKHGGVPAQIKWVNDVFCHGKKVCGISTGASIDLENGGLHYAILGIGINVFPAGGPLPEALAQVATTIFPQQPAGDLRSRIAADVLNYFMTEYPVLTEKRYFHEYRNRSFLLGKPIYVLKGNERIPAHALDLDEEFRLLVRYPDGSQEALSSGEVSVRPQA